MRESILQVIGLPPAFGATLLGLGLILALAPYLGGADFGLFKVPALSAQKLRRLRVLGPLALAVAIALHIPFFLANHPAPAAQVLDTAASSVESKSTPSSPALTMIATIYPDDECQPGSDFGIRTMSTINVGINNQSDRDVVLMSVELVPEWITGSFWAGIPEAAKTYTVILSDWHELVAIAKYPEYEPAQRARLLADGKIRQDKDWYFGHETVTWVSPEPIFVKQIPSDVFTVERNAQERFQISLGLSRSIDFLYGTLRLRIETDDQKQLESGSLKFSICNRDSDPK